MRIHPHAWVDTIFVLLCRQHDNYRGACSRLSYWPASLRNIPIHPCLSGQQWLPPFFCPKWPAASASGLVKSITRKLVHSKSICHEHCVWIHFTLVWDGYATRSGNTAPREAHHVERLSHFELKHTYVCCMLHVLCRKRRTCPYCTCKDDDTTFYSLRNGHGARVPRELELNVLERWEIRGLLQAQGFKYYRHKVWNKITEHTSISRDGMNSGKCAHVCVHHQVRGYTPAGTQTCAVTVRRTSLWKHTYITFAYVRILFASAGAPHLSIANIFSRTSITNVVI